MYLTNVTDDYNNIALNNYTDVLNDYNIITLSNCTNSENNIDKNIPAIFLTVPCGLSFLCFLSPMA